VRTSEVKYAAHGNAKERADCMNMSSELWRMSIFLKTRAESTPKKAPITSEPPKIVQNEPTAAWSRAHAG